MKKYKNVELGLLLIRLALAVVFIYHGWQKLSNMQQTIGFFATLGLAPFIAYLVAIVEFFGGVAMLLGMYVEEAGLAFAAVMTGAILIVKLPLRDFVKMEIDLVLLLTSLAIAFIGSGEYKLHRKKHTG